MEPAAKKPKVSIYWLVIFQIILVLTSLVTLFIIFFWDATHSCMPDQPCTPWGDPKFGFWDWAVLAGAISVLALAVVTFVLIVLRWKIAREFSIAWAALGAGLLAWAGYESAQPYVVLGKTYQSYYGALNLGFLVILNVAWIVYFARSSDVKAQLSDRLVTNKPAQESQNSQSPSQTQNPQNP